MLTSRFAGREVPDCYHDVNWLRDTGATPHFFGLGFIQLKLESDLRMHFWHPTLQPTTGPEEVHDHRYDFVSTVMCGRLVHETWDFRSHSDGLTQIVEVSCKPDVPSPPEPVGQGTMILTGRYELGAGSSYFFPANQFHRTIATTGAVTMLERGVVKKDYAFVLRPINAASVCPFATKMDVNELWTLIEEALS